MSQYGLIYYFIWQLSVLFFSLTWKLFFIHQYSEHPEEYANRSSTLNSELTYKDTLVTLYAWPTWTQCKICVGKSFALKPNFRLHRFLLSWLYLTLKSHQTIVNVTVLLHLQKSNSCVLWATIFLIFSMSTLAIKF